MAIHYINPEATFNGDGTLPTDASGAGQPGAFNAWPTLTANDTYSLKGGTTLATTGLFVNQSGVTVNSYGTGKAIIDGYTSTGAKTISVAQSNQTYDNLIIKGPFTGTGTSAHCFQTSGGTTWTNFTVTNCTLIGQADISSGVSGAGISWQGNFPIVIDNNEMYSLNVGVHFTSTEDPAGSVGNSISNNYIHSMSGADSDAGDCDCISMLGLATGDFGWQLRIANNRLRDWKENAIDVASGRRIIVENNDVGPNDLTYDYVGGSLNTTIAIMVGNTGGTFAGNCIIRGNYVHDVETPGTNTAVGFSNRDSFAGTLCYSNIVVGSDEAYNSFPTAAGQTWTYYNNIAINPSGNCFRLDNEDHEVYNCIIVGGTYGLFSNNGSATITYGGNCLYNSSLGTTGGNNTFSDDGGNITIDPQLDSNYIPNANGPAYRAGKPLGFNMKDFKGHKFKTPPTIGAYEFTSGSIALDREVAI
jgi:hypothetical protein